MTTELQKLEALLNKQYAYNFDEEDILVLKKVIKVMQGFEALGSVGGFLTKGLLWFGSVVAAYVALKADLMGIISDLVANFRG